ncbi:MAG TPA: hypothetical protein VN577_15500 [Terriglobales bacterium]|nr:hypothetical protein [Terriglobales bacterium]
MSIQVERSGFDPTVGFQYYLYFKPHMEQEGADVRQRIPVEVAVSVSESGDLADCTFELPKTLRSDAAISFLRRQEGVNYVPPHVFIDFPGQSGDAVIRAAANLDLDLAGRIMGMELLWSPQSD